MPTFNTRTELKCLKRDRESANRKIGSKSVPFGVM